MEGINMNCWKTVNFHKQYGAQRLFILSSMTMIGCFLFLYVPITTYFAHNKLSDDYFLLFMAMILLMYPLHKLLHLLPMIHLGDKIKKTWNRHLQFLPVLHIQVKEPIGKIHFQFALIVPFVIISGLLLLSCFLFTSYVHYFLMLFAYHTGMCVPDFIRMKNLWRSPRSCYVEENEDGFEILINNVSELS